MESQLAIAAMDKVIGIEWQLGAPESQEEPFPQPAHYEIPEPRSHVSIIEPENEQAQVIPIDRTA